jgi:nucleotide-binding universal stress UspA family protein
MKRILVPIDFSELSENAYGIASKLAKGTNAEITVLTIIPGPSGAVYSD